jgi:hypothetical protein
MPGGGGGRGGGFGAGNFTAGTGDYGVILTIGSTTLKQLLHVENVGGGDPSSPFGPAAGDDDREAGKGKTARSK